MVAVREVMRVYYLATAIVLLGGGLAKGLAKREVVPEPRLAKFRLEVEPVLKRVCVGCHGPGKQKGKFRVDTLDPNLLKGKDVKWGLEVFDVVGNGEMPPEDAEAQLTDVEKARIVDWLSGEIQVASEVRRSEQGHTSFRRLTRYEYRYALQDLLGIPHDFSRDLPPETASEDGFKNSSELLQMTAVQFEQYRELARKALERATVRGARPQAVYYGISMRDAAKRINAKYTANIEGTRKRIKEEGLTVEEAFQQQGEKFERNHNGMHYRDLIPDRLGGSIIASHIRIPDGGPVPDMVHYHTVGFQLIYCYRGWVDLVYEDQGEPFRLFAGNCVIQPPEIRHKVLYASENIEVIEIGVPAEHITTIDHDMELPNGPPNPAREFQGQTFVHHKAPEAEWVPFRIPGFICRDTTIAENTKDVAGVQVIRPDGSATPNSWHDSDILFTFVLEGQMTLEGEGRDPFELTAGDAFVIPPSMTTRYTKASDDLELLEVSLPGRFKTRIVEHSS